MRIIAGSLGGRRIVAPRGPHTRPTSDRVREALFSALGDVGGASVLDLYAGSGALALEALSRGAARAVCVERAPAALRCLGDNVRALGVADRCRVLALDVRRAGKSLAALGPFDLVLCDPPYAETARAVEALAALIATPGIVAPGARIVIEHAARDAVVAPRGTTHERTRRYGDTALSSWRVPTGDPF